VATKRAKALGIDPLPNNLQVTQLKTTSKELNLNLSFERCLKSSRAFILSDKKFSSTGKKSINISFMYRQSSSSDSKKKDSGS
jgi:hypothetical protein